MIMNRVTIKYLIIIDLNFKYAKDRKIKYFRSIYNLFTTKNLLYWSYKTDERKVYEPKR